MVYVLSKSGKPLMPTERHGKVKHMLRDGRAVVVQRTPFTIQLTYDSTEYTQTITLGVAAGSKVVGLSATAGTKELYAAECKLRTDIVDLISSRRQYRRARRSRKTRYRAPRFDNRVKPKGWVAPSVEQRIGTHINLINKAHKILPITRVVVQVAAFDIQRIKNPEIGGKEYQNGEMAGHAGNVREYVLWRDGHKCRHCGGKSKDNILNVHHLESRKTGGDAPNNLITLCKTCHTAYHSGDIKLTVKRGASYRDAAFMGIMRWTLCDRLKKIYPNVSMTFGYITKNKRITAGLAKSHSTDARCISGNPMAEATDVMFSQKAVRRHNRKLHRDTINKGGYRKLNQAPKYVFGYKLFDKVRMPDGQEGFIFARRTSGSFNVRTLDGTKLSAGITYKKLKPLEKGRTILTERGRGSSPCLKAGVSAA
jgi:N6-L-threonylcarbamoyladenine synthase